ncbi:MAG TPA: hypothetical protein PLC92_05910, partial [Chitinophagales bacterium]|nr:hypothetical protein [Chitinophagales bacterium]
MDLISNQHQLSIAQTENLLRKLDDFIPENELEWFSNDLKAVINFHDQLYYVQSNSVITDFDYDRLFKKLKQIEEENPNLITADSPTQRVAKGLNKEF